MHSQPLQPKFSSIPTSSGLHRTAHGALAWSAGFAMYQPQDGAAPAVTNVSEIASRRTRMLHEPEDARITGGTRSLMRRLLGLNMGTRRGISGDGARIARVA